jgi:DHA3 family macrolide efflux protein-like MFS transporter
MIVLSAVFLFLFAPAVLLTPLQVTRNFGNDVWRLSAIEIIFSIGMMAGGIFIGI